MGIPFFMPAFTPDMRAAAIDALDNEFYILGESVSRFEEKFADYVGAKHAVAVSSGTNALSLTMDALGVAGGEVITSPTSFIASSNAVIHARGRPVFTDVAVEDANLDPEKVAAGITDQTRALLPVHLYGRCADMAPLKEIAQDHDIPLIEDACQAHGAEYGGHRAGGLADAACFSFYTTKNLFVGGDGGMVTTDDEELATAIRSLRDSGRAPGERYLHDRIGYTARLNTVQAAIGAAGLDHLEDWIKARRHIANRYREGLAGLPLRLPPEDRPGGRDVYHLFTINTEQRDALQQHLQSHGIGTAIHYPVPIHQQPIYNELFGETGPFPVAEAHASTTLSLPMHPGLDDQAVDTVVEAVRAFHEKEVPA